MIITINKNDARPLYLQVVIQIKEQIRKGALKQGDELPSVRELADTLGINMHTVRSAYIKLREQGIINLALGRRATIAEMKKPENKRITEAEITARLEELTTDALLMGLKSDEIQKILSYQSDRLRKQ
ncbi:MAG: GntR family transcriptional regulator [Dehalococcoidales bacterium]|nr:GntR family transcriptional regulator [Dehalococcoidales bacterium]